MSVLVRGMKMPEKCGLCDLFHAESPMHCPLVKEHKTVGAPYGMPRPDWCPLVDEEPVKRGKWIKADTQQYFRKHYPLFTCSACGYRKDSQKEWNYCPNCGARMDTK